MKSYRFLLVAVIAVSFVGLLLLARTALAAFDSGSTGADGAFNPTASIEVTLPPDGIFNFTTVNIPAGVTVTFKKNEKNTPVVILATGDVVIDGAISVNGADANAGTGGLGGPGGYEGGEGGFKIKRGYRGDGVGGGGGGDPRTDYADNAAGGGGGGFGGNGVAGESWGVILGGAAGASYANELILPLIGGSGGGGGGGTTVYVGNGGGGGGGAILIATPGTITVNGSVNAKGGKGAGVRYQSGGGGGGSGGAIRLIADTITGSGSIDAGGGVAEYAYNKGGAGSQGRVRLEAWDVSLTTSPVGNASLASPFAVFPDNLPALKIASIGGIDVTATTIGTTKTPDIELPFNMENPVSVVVSGKNIPVNTQVTVKVFPTYGDTTSATAALGGTEAASTATVPLNIPAGVVSIVYATVTYEATASNGAPLYAEGEKVDRVTIATTLEGASTVTYITESGREIPVRM